MTTFRIHFHDISNIDQKYNFVIILTRCSKTKKWVWVRQANKESWELPGGHVEEGETPDEASKRELYEETGALIFNIKPLFDCTVEIDEQKSLSRIYFAELTEYDTIPDPAIAEIKLFDQIPEVLTHKKIQAEIFSKAKEIVEKMG